MLKVIYDMGFQKRYSDHTDFFKVISYFLKVLCQNYAEERKIEIDLQLENIEHLVSIIEKSLYICEEMNLEDKCEILDYSICALSSLAEK